QGVTIVLLSTRATAPVLRFASVVGTRASKYAKLLAKTPIDMQLTAVPTTPPYHRWVPFASPVSAEKGAAYESWLRVDSVFAQKSSGIQTKNDPICIGWSAKEVFSRVERLAGLNARRAREEFDLAEGGAWSVEAAQADLRTFGVSRKHVRR